MRAGLAGCLAVLVAISGACGGRVVQGGDAGEGADTGTGGGNGSGATMSRGATSSTGAVGQGARGGSVSVGGKAAVGGGANVGGKATGGFGVAGTTAAGGGCACPVMYCAPGYELVPNPDGCCFHCESTCNDVVCPGIACASGYHLETPAGQCCQTCVLDENCSAERLTYQAYRQQLLDKYSKLTCMTDADCGIYYEKNQCAIGCGIPLANVGISSLDSNLQGYAQVNCGPGCMNPIPPCLPPSPPTCFKGYCQ